MAALPLEEITSRITKELAPTSLACSKLTPLSGGSANFIFKGQLLKPLDNDTTEVVIKHGEGYSASFSSLRLSTERCTLEYNCLKAVEVGLPPTINEACSVRTPKVLLYHPETNTQVQEYLPSSLDLKRYALEHFRGPMTACAKPQVIGMGRGLGQWLRYFHDWAATQKPLRDLARANGEMQLIKLAYNYQLLLRRVEQLPDILSDIKAVLEEVFAMAQAELDDETKLQVIHGDFWTGNILLPNEGIKPGQHKPLLVIDWEMCQLWKPQLDLGQMIAELYELTLYKDIQAGLWLIDGFMSGYGFVDDEFAFRTLLHTGTHLVGFGSSVAGWGTPEQCENVARTGRDIILRAWNKDRDWFEKHDLASLLKKI